MDSTWTRRAVTFPGVVILTGLLIGTLPLLLPLLLIADTIAGRQQAWCRLLFFMIGWGICEIGGLLASFALWMFGGAFLGWQNPTMQASHLRLQNVWASTIFGVAKRCFRLRFELTGEVPPPDRPLILFCRHASMIDSFLPAVLFGPRQWRLRYVLKDTLQLSPCLDVVGHRLPNHFVKRGRGEQEGEAVAALASGLTPGEGILLFPEGTRFNSRRHKEAMERLAKNDPERLTRLQGLRHVLPPRTRGPQVVLEQAPDADLCLLTHAGFDGFANLGDFLGDGLIGRQILVKLETFDRVQIPEGRDARVAWLDEQWIKMDAWLDTVHQELG